MVEFFFAMIPSGMDKAVAQVTLAAWFKNLCTNSPPWFIKHLPSVTTDNVEMRLCAPTTDGSTPIEIVELHVQLIVIANDVVIFILKVIKFVAKAMKIVSDSIDVDPINPIL